MFTEWDQLREAISNYVKGDVLWRSTTISPDAILGFGFSTPIRVWQGSSPDGELLAMIQLDQVLTVGKPSVIMNGKHTTHIVLASFPREQRKFYIFFYAVTSSEDVVDTVERQLGLKVIAEEAGWAHYQI